MDIQEASRMGDISMYYDKDESTQEYGWYWDICCGYQSFFSHTVFSDVNAAYQDLISFISDWEGPTK